MVFLYQRRLVQLTRPTNIVTRVRFQELDSKDVGMSMETSKPRSVVESETDRKTQK